VCLTIWDTWRAADHWATFYRKHTRFWVRGRGIIEERNGRGRSAWRNVRRGRELQHCRKKESSKGIVILLLQEEWDWIMGILVWNVRECCHCWSLCCKCTEFIGCNKWSFVVILPLTTPAWLLSGLRTMRASFAARETKMGTQDDKTPPYALQKSCGWTQMHKTDLWWGLSFEGHQPWRVQFVRHKRLCKK
jgi:hypothetical protein